MSDDDTPDENDKTQIAPSASEAKAPERTIISQAITPAPVPPPPPPPPTDGAAVPVGTVINNNYRITQLISAGGMGEVFRGENTFTGDAVAIKIVLQSLAHDEKIAALFMREAKVLCGLSDQAIVRYYNFVRDADLDRFCLIMEFIDGEALSDFVKDKRPMDIAEATRLLRRLAGGLARAHDMDVVHRDLSPDNVMLRDGDIDKAVLIDFGIAKSSEMAESTLHGQLAGKFKFISPEQLGHFGGEIGPRTDIYGLGLLMASALLGTPLDMGSTVVEAVNARRSIPDLRPVDAALRPLLAHMLEPDPASRPARMEDVIAILDDPSLLPESYAALGDMGPGAAPKAAPFEQTGGFGVSGIAPEGPAASASPFGPPSIVPSAAPAQVSMPGSIPAAGAAKIAQPGQTTGQTAVPRRPVETTGGGAGGAVRWVLVLIALTGAGAFFANQQGLLFPSDDPVAETDPLPDPVTQTASGPVTRASFLAEFATGNCGFAARMAAGPQAGMLVTFAAEDGVFDGLSDAYEGLFDASPAVIAHRLSAAQCPVADLAKALTLRPGAAPVLALDSDEMQSGGSIVGRLSNRQGRPVWLGLVTTVGGVYNLTDRLTEQADGSATFSFGLNAGDEAGVTPQVLIAIAADAPLIAAAAATDGADAASLLPLIEAEVSGRDGAAGIALGYFDLVP